MFVRIYDIMHGYYHLGALTSFLDLAPPLSNYSELNLKTFDNYKVQDLL